METSTMASSNGVVEPAPLLQDGVFQEHNSTSDQLEHTVSHHQRPQSLSQTEETSDTLQTQGPGLPHLSSATSQTFQREEGHPVLPPRTESSVSTVKPEAAPSIHNEKATGESVHPIGGDVPHSGLRPVITPLACLTLGAVLALGHHLFNEWANGRTLGRSPNISQQWVLRAGTAFAFAFQAILAAGLSFVICQVLWYYARRKFLTLSDLNTLYLIERRDIVPAWTSNAIARAPLLVLVVTFAIMLPIAAIFTPASLSVVYRVTTSTGSCAVSAGNITSFNSTRIYSTTDGIFLGGMSGLALKVAQPALMGGVIPSLPMFCGDNCIYQTSTDSMTFQCQEGVTLPSSQMGNVDPAHPGPGTRTYWNATSDGSSSDPASPFYVGWRTDSYTDGMSEYLSGTTGSAHCTPMLAHYKFSVQRVNGVQTVSYTTEITGPMAPSTSYDQNNQQPTFAALQIGAIGLAARNYLLGSISITSNPAQSHNNYNTSVISASFLNVSTIGGESYVWGDVVGGIQGTAANLTASMLLLNLGGTVDSTCTYTNQELVYDYHWPGLWIPYGIALLIVALSLVFGILIFVRFNPNNLTTSLTDTIFLTQNTSFEKSPHQTGGYSRPTEEAHGTRYKLEDANGRLEFAPQRDFT